MKDQRRKPIKKRTNLTRRYFLKMAGASLLGGITATSSFSWWGKASPQTIKVGGILTLTGGNAPTGKGIAAGAQVATQTINQQGGIAGRIKVNLVVEDSKTSLTEATTIAHRLVNRGDISFVFGPIISSFGLATQPILAAARIPQIYLGATRKFTQNHDKYPLSIRYGTQALLQTAPVVKYAVAERNQDRLFVIAPNTDRGRGIIQATQRQLERLGKGKLIGTELYPPFNREFSTVITKVRNSGATAMLVGSGVPMEIIGAAQEYNRQVANPDKLGFYTGQTPNGSIAFWEEVAKKGKANGFIYDFLYEREEWGRSFPRTAPPTQATQMESAFLKQRGHRPSAGQLAAWGWGSLYIIKQAIEGLIEKRGEEAVLSLDPIKELPQEAISYILGENSSPKGGPIFNTPFGNARFLPCGQFNLRLGVATFKDRKQYLLKDRGYGEELIGPLCG